MKEIQRFAGTGMYNILHNVAAVYTEIDKNQKQWKQKTPAPCPEGCGRCCEHFEPDVYEYEALYLAAWLLEHQTERAEEIRLYGAGKSGHNTDGCFLFDPHNPHHCTVYDARCLICRLFGYSGLRGKDSRIRWKPCKFIFEAADIDERGGQSGKNILLHRKNTVEQREYDENELNALFGTIPPDMTYFSAQLLALNPGNTVPRPLRKALPEAVEKLKLILRFAVPDEPDSPEPDMPSPCPLSA